MRTAKLRTRIVALLNTVLSVKRGAGAKSAGRYRTSQGDGTVRERTDSHPHRLGYLTAGTTEGSRWLRPRVANAMLNTVRNENCGTTWRQLTASSGPRKVVSHLVIKKKER